MSELVLIVVAKEVGALLSLNKDDTIGAESVDEDNYDDVDDGTVVVVALSVDIVCVRIIWIIKYARRVSNERSVVERHYLFYGICCFYYLFLSDSKCNNV